jgi:hypothetical protein
VEYEEVASKGKTLAEKLKYKRRSNNPSLKLPGIPVAPE